MQRPFAAFFLFACASDPAAPLSAPEAASAATDERAPSEAAAPAPFAAPSEASEAPAEPPDSKPEASSESKALPAIKVRNVGLHVGGGANDRASKQPFLRAVERQFPEFLRCYRLVSEPGTEGTFGVDIQVPKAGGKATLEEPRTALAGEEFRACMVKAFEAVDFEPTPKPVVISYSLRFYLEDGDARPR